MKEKSTDISFIDIVLISSSILLVCMIIFMGVLFVYYAIHEPLDDSQSVPTEQNVMKYEEIPATIVSVDKRQWFAACAHRMVIIKVHSDKYNIDRTFDETYNGMLVGPLWEVKEGQEIKVKVCYYVKPSTGERVSKPYITNLVYASLN